MKLMILLGNGFDLALGLNTRYTDFYHAFLANLEANNINASEKGLSEHQELIDMIKNQELGCWADLELLLGNSVEKFSDIEKLRTEKIFLEEKLNTYLELEQDRLSVQPEKNVELKQKMDSMILQMIERLGWEVDNTKVIDIQFVTFNYTYTIDKIVECINQMAHVLNTIAASVGGNQINYLKPMHVHGGIDNNIILGVDNGNQYNDFVSKEKMLILNKNRLDNMNSVSIINSKDEELSLIMEKPRLNELLRAPEISKIKASILSSDKVIIYGSSLGETDSCWWEFLLRWAMDDGIKRNSDRQIGIFAFIKGLSSPSATAKIQLLKHKKKFMRYWSKVDKKKQEETENSRENRVIIKNCEDWMFNFDEQCGINLASERLFTGLTMGE